ncbi:hypothetical protein [Streptomyces synnematoformans]|uniref:Secreted protein n=1 Tax=Streptomyces synnematoformans TaxID=415721 RepID=A0ABN2YS95_9ACTN
MPPVTQARLLQAAGTSRTATTEGVWTNRLPKTRAALVAAAGAAMATGLAAAPAQSAEEPPTLFATYRCGQGEGNQQKLAVTGGHIEFRFKCSGTTVTVYDATVHDTKADGWCVYAQGTFNSTVESNRACPKGDIDSFDWRETDSNRQFTMRLLKD